MLRIFLFCLISIVLAQGCEQTNDVSKTGVLNDLSSMDSMRVSLTVFSRHTRLEMHLPYDSSMAILDEKHTYCFTSVSATPSIEWADSGFSAKAQFTMWPFAPFPYGQFLSTMVSSTMAGYYDEQERRLRDLRCVMKSYNPATFQSVNASIAIDELRLSAINRDSIEFIANGHELKDVVSVGLVSEQSLSNGSYTRRRLDSLMWEEPTVEPVLRVVFYPKD